MSKTKDAYKILGLKEGVTKDEISKKYDLLFRKYRAKQREGLDKTDDGVDFQDIIKAYNLLMGYDTGEPAEGTEFKENPVLKKLGIDEKKAGNFLHYYKFHLIIGIIVLLFLAYTIRGCIYRVEPDLYIAFIGNFAYNDSNILKQNIINIIPGIKEPSIDGAFLTNESRYEMQMKAMVLIAAADVDVYILDKVNFEKFAKQGAFKNLDELAGEMDIDRDKNKDYILSEEEKVNETHLFGIDVSSSSLLKESEVFGEEKIAVLSVKAKNYENAIKLLKALVKGF